MNDLAGLPVDSVVDIVETLAIVVGIGFAVIQLRQVSVQRKDHAAVDIVRTVQTQEVRRAVGKVFTLPIDADPQLITNDREMLDAALAVDSACEMWGCMAFEGVVDHKMLDRMVGGWVRGTWQRLHLWTEEERRLAGNLNIGEWWQWLYELLEADPDTGKQQGAHVAYRGLSRRK
jgi:hypothetical protein